MGAWQCVRTLVGPDIRKAFIFLHYWKSVSVASSMMSAAPSTSIVDTAIFTQLQVKIDEDVLVREQIRDAIQDLERQRMPGTSPFVPLDVTDIRRTECNINPRTGALFANLNASMFVLMLYFLLLLSPQHWFRNIANVLLKMEAEHTIEQVRHGVRKLEAAALGHPYYKYNSMWSREMQNAVGKLSLVWHC